MTLLDGADWNSKIFSNGWTSAQGGTLQTTEPATGEVLAEVGLANKGDVAEAARRARFGSQSSWDEFTHWQWLTVRDKPHAFPF